MARRGRLAIIDDVPKRNRNAVLNALRDKAAQLPASPGVYLFKDAAGAVLYVGKAKDLRSRVASYLQPGADLLGSRGPEILHRIEQLAVDVDMLECESEVDALLRESRLIKDIQPPFNERLKDDKTFPYLEIVTCEDFPHVAITRQPQREGTKLYGPFVSVKDLRAALPLMQRVFKFRTCKPPIDADDERRLSFRPCILYSIKQCTAPCAGKVSKDSYAVQIKHLRQFLASKASQLRRDLTARMKAAAQALDFEQAATLRDELRAMEGLQKRGLVHDHVQPEVFFIDPAEGLEQLGSILEMDSAPRTLEGVDIAHLQGGESCGAVVSYIDGKPFKSGYRRYKIKTHDRNDDCASIREVVWRRYKYAGMNAELFPDVILIDGGPGQLAAAYAAFDELEFTPPMLISLAKKQEEIFVHGRARAVRLPRHDEGLRLLQSVRDEAHRFAQHYHHILRRRATLERNGPVKSQRKAPRQQGDTSQ